MSFAIFLGHTLHEVFVLREGRFPRIPDFVIWPGIAIQIVHTTFLCTIFVQCHTL